MGSVAVKRKTRQKMNIGTFVSIKLESREQNNQRSVSGLDNADEDKNK